MDKTLNRIFFLLPHKPDGTIVRGAKKELADKLGIDKNIISQWQAGSNRSYTKYLYQIAAIYGVSVSWLRGDTDDPAPAPVPQDPPGGKTDIVRLLEENADRIPTEVLLRLISAATDQLQKRK